MEQFERILRDQREEGVSIRELARRHKVHRRAVRQALASAVPPPRKPVESRAQPAIGRYRVVVLPGRGRGRRRARPVRLHRSGLAAAAAPRLVHGLHLRLRRRRAAHDRDPQLHREHLEPGPAGGVDLVDATGARTPTGPGTSSRRTATTPGATGSG